MTTQNARGETVLLLHGLWMNRLAMLPLARALASAGFAPRALRFPSMRGTLEENVATVEDQLAALPEGTVHLLGHSLGGLLAFELLRRHAAGALQARRARLGRVVLLGAPLSGCEAAHAFAKLPGGRMMLGKTHTMWSPESPQRPAMHIPASCQVGAIAGTRRFGLGALLVSISGENDGVVRVAETRLNGLADHITLPVSHSGMLLSAEVARQCAAFLHDAEFAR